MGKPNKFKSNKPNKAWKQNVINKPGPTKKNKDSKNH